MTDYLEDLSRTPDALLDQLKKLTGDFLPLGPLEAQVPPPTPEPAPNSLPALPSPEPVPPEVNMTPGQQPENFLQSSLPTTIQENPPVPPDQSLTSSEHPMEPSLPSQSDGKNLPLLDQLQQLQQVESFLQERRPSQNVPLAPPEDHNTLQQPQFPLALPKLQSGQLLPELDTPSGWSWRLAPENAQVAAGGSLSLAEQTDLAFRRDSRRYDGSFYLY